MRDGDQRDGAQRDGAQRDGDQRGGDQVAWDVPDEERGRCAVRAWDAIRGEAERLYGDEPALHGMLDVAVLRHDSLGTALTALLARKLGDDLLRAPQLEGVFAACLAADAEIVAAAAADLGAIEQRDPAARAMLTPFLAYKGFQALQAHRIAHRLWQDGRGSFARLLQSRSSEVFGVDIHPAVPVGRRVFIDHGTGLVVGETAVIGHDVSILQAVTLGGTGKDRGDRHPKVRNGVLLAAGAIVLGNIEIGRGATVGAGSVVLKDVPPCATVAGVPARIVGWCRDTVAALGMNQSLPERGA